MKEDVYEGPDDGLTEKEVQFGFGEDIDIVREPLELVVTDMIEAHVRGRNIEVIEKRVEYDTTDHSGRRKQEQPYQFFCVHLSVPILGYRGSDGKVNNINLFR